MTTFESMYTTAYQKAKLERSTYSKISVKSITPFDANDCRVEAVDKIRMSITITYNRTETMASGKVTNSDTTAKTWVILTRDGDTWMLDSAETNMLKFY
jgi:hypothetical protein